MREIKYRHPIEDQLTWSGKGKKPVWVEAFLAEGKTLKDLEVGSHEVITLTQAQSSEPNGRDLINQLLGQAQAFTAASQLLQTFGVSKLAYVKENGIYRDLAGMSAPNGLELKGTWEEFCGLLGMSDEKANQDIANLRAFGEEAMEAMTRMGIGYRELRQFRKLPPEQREALALIAKDGSKEDVLEAALEALEKERKAAEQLQVTNAELAEDVKAAERRAKNLDAEIERKDSQLKRLTDAKARTTAFLLRTEEVREECMALQAGGELHLNSLRKLFEEVVADGPDAPEWQLQVEQIWVMANTLAARAYDLVEHIANNAHNTKLPDRVLSHHILGEEEAVRWLLDFPMLVNKHEAEKAARAERREADKPKGPGRPKGAANKPKTAEA